MIHLTDHDRRTWGPCPVCRSKHGLPCVHSTRPGASHTPRLRRAPAAVSWLRFQQSRVIAAVNRAVDRGPEVTA